jgi:post-segregation antitoxin (ccd killing protein)
MSLVKTSISIPEELLSEARASSDNLSSLITVALREYMRQKKVEKAISSFGSWEQREQESVELVNEIRKTRKRSYASRSN